MVSYGVQNDNEALVEIYFTCNSNDESEVAISGVTAAFNISSTLDTVEQQRARPLVGT